MYYSTYIFQNAILYRISYRLRAADIGPFDLQRTLSEILMAINSSSSSFSSTKNRDLSPHTWSVETRSVESLPVLGYVLFPATVRVQASSAAGIGPGSYATVAEFVIPFPLITSGTTSDDSCTPGSASAGFEVMPGHRQEFPVNLRSRNWRIEVQWS